MGQRYFSSMGDFINSASNKTWNGKECELNTNLQRIGTVLNYNALQDMVVELILMAKLLLLLHWRHFLWALCQALSYVCACLCVREYWGQRKRREEVLMFLNCFPMKKEKVNKHVKHTHKKNTRTWSSTDEYELRRFTNVSFSSQRLSLLISPLSGQILIDYMFLVKSVNTTLAVHQNSITRACVRQLFLSSNLHLVQHIISVVLSVLTGDLSLCKLKYLSEPPDKTK